MFVTYPQAVHSLVLKIKRLIKKKKNKKNKEISKYMAYYTERTNNRERYRLELKRDSNRIRLSVREARSKRSWSGYGAESVRSGERAML